MTRSMLNRLQLGWVIVAAAAFSLAGCDYLDPTQVDNPATTDEDLAQAVEPTAALLPGLRAMFARAVDPVGPELVSDNYNVAGTGIDAILDNPRRITPDEMDRQGRFYAFVQELRALADFVIDDIAANDETVTDDQLGEARYYRGMAYLLMAERYVAVPIDTNGTPVTSADLLDLALTELSTAQSIAGTEFANASTAALARANHLAGNATAAEAAANAVLAANPSYTFGVEYDPTTVINGPFIFLYLRALKEMEPLPRLDFLDPKYTSRAAPIYMSKAEEMHLLLAEVEFAEGNWAAGREQIALAIELSDSRPRVAFDDDDARLSADLSERPHDASILVRADENSPYRAGLVLSRPGVVSTPTVSGTSLVADSIRNIAPAEQESLLHALFLARQEMLMLEGRRMTELGIRLPISQAEINTNPNIDDGDLGTEPFVPSFIPSEGELDRFSPRSPYDDDGNLTTNEITMMWDMNRVLAQNWNGFGPVAAPNN